MLVPGLLSRCRCLPLPPKFARILLLTCLLPCAAARADPPVPALNTISSQQVAEQIEQLGAADFAEREAAMQRLEQTGRPALPQLRRALSNPSLEIRYRSRTLIDQILRDDHAHRVSLLLQQGDAADSSLLPGLKRFREQVGNDPAALQIFAEMQLSAPDLMLTLAGLENQPVPHSAAAAAELQFEQYLAEMRYTWQSQKGKTRELTPLYVALFAAAEPGRKMSPQLAGMLSGHVNATEFRTVMEKAKSEDVPVRLLAAWIATEDDANSYQKLTLAMRYQLREGLLPAIELLKNPANGSMTQAALLTVARFGDRSHLPLVEKLLTDETVLNSSRNRERVVWTIQTRDVALVAAIHLCGEKPEEFGFTKLQKHPMYLYQYSTAGFTSETLRAVSFARWAEYRSKHPDQ